MGSAELWLPEPAIERIQYFLDAKEAARTMILSKSWYNVWLNRLNLNFDHYELYDQRVKRFLEFVDKTLSRYEESNLKIQSFRICLRNCGSGEFIVRALKICASHFTLYLRGGSSFVLPDEVFESAEDLTLIGCDFNPNPLVTCNSRLQSLCLTHYEFKNPDPISNILSSCPLIQYLSLYNISFVKTVDYNRSDDYDGYYDNYSTNDIGYITKPLMWLTTLELKYVHFDMLFLGDLSYKFPMLKDLTLIMTLKKYQEEIRISSNSLERLTFTLRNSRTCTRCDHPYKRQMFTFDFPSIRKFTYKSSVIPLLSLESNSMGYWESHLSIRRRNKCLTASWFRRLSDFLTKLRHSKVFLSLRVRSVTSFDYEAGDIQGFPTSEIEDLIIDHQELSPLTCYALLDGLFRICHPKLITQCETSTCFRVKKKHIEQLGQILLNGVQLDNEKTMLTRSHFMYGLNDLKEASAQIINEAAVTSTCRDVQLDALLEHLKTAKGKQEVRFHLNWQPTTTPKKLYLKMSIHQKIEELDNDQAMNPDKGNRLSPIEQTKYYSDVEMVCYRILKNSGSGELVRRKMKPLLKLLQDGFPECDNVDDANKICCMLYDVLREPCFVNALRESKANYSIDHCAAYLSKKNRSPMERVAHMKADWRFKPTLMSLQSDTTYDNTMRVFLIILLAHWSDKGELSELDKRMGKKYFGKYLDCKI